MAGLIDTITGAVGDSLGLSSNVTSALGDIVGGAGTALGLNKAIQNVEDLQTDIKTQAGDYITKAGTSSAFQPFTVTSAGGTADIGAAGGLTTTPLQSGLTSSLQSRAGTLAGATAPTDLNYGNISSTALRNAYNLLGQQAPTAQTLFDQMQAMSMPEQQRQRLALENRLAAQGRLGTQTAAYGGTPEALALEKAIQEQQAKNLLSAQTLAPQLAQQQTAQAAGLFGLGSQAAAMPQQLEAGNIQNISALLGTSYAPENQLLSALSPALQAAQLAQTGRASETQAIGQLGPSVLESLYKTGETAATLEQAQINAVLEALGIGSQQAPSDTIFNIGAPEITMPEIAFPDSTMPNITIEGSQYTPEINVPVTVG